MILIKQVLAQRGSLVLSVSPNTKLMDVIKLMTDRDVGALVVMDEGKIVGIFSERDFARVVARTPNLAMDAPVSDFMTKNVRYVTSDVTVDDCMALMIEKRIRHLPIMEGDKVLGVLSMRDMVREVISEKELTIRGLENYILNREYPS